MKKKNELKKKAIKLDLEKIEIDILTISMINGLQGGYQTQPIATNCGCPSNLCTFDCSRVPC
jgi:hypothetical protein